MGPEGIIQMAPCQLVAQRNTSPRLCTSSSAHRARRRSPRRRISVDEDARETAARERSSEVGRDERGAGATARGVHDDHGGPAFEQDRRSAPMRPSQLESASRSAGQMKNPLAPTWIAVRSDPIDSLRVEREQRPGERRAKPPHRTRDGCAITASGSSCRIASSSCRSSPAMPTTRAWPLLSRKCMTSSATSCCSIASTTLATWSMAPPVWRSLGEVRGIDARTLAATTDKAAARARKRWLPSAPEPRLPAMAVVMLRAPLKDRADGRSQVELPGDSIGQVLRELERRYPRLEGWILDEHGRVRRHVNVFVDGERARGDPGRRRARASTSCHRSPEEGTDDRTVGGNQEGAVRACGASDDGPFEIATRAFPGDVVEFAMRDPRTGRYFASVTSGFYGPRLLYTDDPTGGVEAGEGSGVPRGPARRHDRADLDREARRGRRGALRGRRPGGTVREHGLAERPGS